jgi:peroxiredoxin
MRGLYWIGMVATRLLPALIGLALVVAAAAPLAAAPAAPPFTARLLDDGREVDSRALLGKKVLVLRFQGSWCKTCTAQSAGIQRLAEKYRDRDVEVIGVHVNDTATEVRAWRKRYRQTYPAALDQGARVATRFGFKRAPYTVIIDQKGEMVARITGSADEARLAKLLDPLLAPPQSTTR